MSETLQTAIERRLNEYHLGADGPASLRDLARETPTPLLLTHPLGSQRFRAVVTDSPTLTRVLQLDGEFGDPLLLLAPAVNPRGAHELRVAGVQFLDAAGNAYLRFGGVLIDVRGRRPDPVSYTHLTLPTILLV